MDAVIDNLPRFCEGFGTTLAAARLLRRRRARARDRRRRDAHLAGRRRCAVRHRVHRARAQHPAHPRPLLLRVHPAVPRFVAWPYFLLALIGLTVYTSPFVAEALRSGINGVPVGQAEAARSIGLASARSLTLVILPQAFRMVIPPLINVFIALTKNTSVAGGFFVVELFGAAATAGQRPTATR